MERFAWDIDHILKRQEYYKNLSEKEENDNYNDLYDMYSLLIMERLFSEGTVVSSGMNANEKLREARSEIGIVGYEDERSSLQERILFKLSEIDDLFPYVHFNKSMNEKNLVHLIGEAIHDIFGDKAYRDYRNLAIDNTSRIQIGNQETRACLHLVKDNEKNDVYILLPKQSNIMAVNSLSHEAGHHHRIVENDAEILEDNLLREYESFSYELRVLDFFIKNGIYKKEAIKAMVRVINLIDTFAGIFNEQDLLDALTVKDLTRKAHDRELYKKLHIPNNEFLLDYLYTVKTEYMFPYIYSALCVFEDMDREDGIDHYERVIHNIGRQSEMELIENIVDNPEDINNLNGYKKYRKEIKSIMMGE